MNKELTNALEKIYKSKFSKSGISFKKGCFGNDTLFMDLFLANDKSEVANGYFNNDMFNISFRIKDLGNDNYSFENLAKSYNIRPNEKWLAYSHTELSFRKVVGGIDKITKSFEKFVDRLEQAIKNDIANDLIHDNYKNLVMEKIGK